MDWRHAEHENGDMKRTAHWTDVNAAGQHGGRYDGFMSQLATIEDEDVDTRISITAHHEAGHAAIAARLGLRLRAEGIMVGQDAEGLACYCKQPDGTDASVEANILASFAGCYAENHFRNLQGYQVRDYATIMGSLDWNEARGIEGRFSWDYLAGRIIPTVHASLEAQAEQLAVANWPAIAALARALLDKEWEPKKALKSGARWSEAAMAKYLLGEEIVEILAPLGINATCVQQC